jgi:electron transfer flavoprotein beta subunit
MRGIMAARTKPLTVLAPKDAASSTHYNQYETPAAKSGVKLIEADNAAELINILRNDLKII